MVLNKENFIVQLIQFNSVMIKTSNLQIDRFTSSNKSPYLNYVSKYKLMLKPIEIENDTNICIRVILKQDDNFFQAYHFPPSFNKLGKNECIGLGRVYNINIKEENDKNIIDRIWIYFSHDYINGILSRFSSTKDIMSSDEYLTEYLGDTWNVLSN